MYHLVYLPFIPLILPWYCILNHLYIKCSISFCITIMPILYSLYYLVNKKKKNVKKKKKKKIIIKKKKNKKKKKKNKMKSYPICNHVIIVIYLLVYIIS